MITDALTRRVSTTSPAPASAPLSAVTPAIFAASTSTHPISGVTPETWPLTFPSRMKSSRIQEAYLAATFASHEISIGKSDEWFGPGRGGGMGYSNNAEDIYSIRI